MVRVFLLVLVFYFYFIICSRRRVLILLLLIEFIILFCFFYLVFIRFSYIIRIFFILIGVCIGAYSICVFIFIYRSKSSSYLISRGMEVFF